MGEMKALVVGVTGSRNGTTRRQLGTLRAWVNGHPRGTLQHGDCIGADEDAHITFLRAGWRIEIRPGRGLEHLRAYCHGADVVYPEKPHLERNSDIVAASDELVGLPEGPETPRSGTWSTIRKARAKGIRRTIIWPDGSITVEPGDTDELLLKDTPNG